jgi:hypothetical protein
MQQRPPASRPPNDVDSAPRGFVEIVPVLGCLIAAQ